MHLEIGIFGYVFGIHTKWSWTLRGVYSVIPDGRLRRWWGCFYWSRWMTEEEFEDI